MTKEILLILLQFWGHQVLACRASFVPHVLPHVLCRGRAMPHIAATAVFTPCLLCRAAALPHVRGREMPHLAAPAVPPSRPRYHVSAAFCRVASQGRRQTHTGKRTERENGDTPTHTRTNRREELCRELIVERDSVAN